MNIRNLIGDDEAVSPVIGVILMVAITVILAAVIGTFVLGQADQLNENAPTTDFSYDGDESNGYTVLHAGGDAFLPSTATVTTDSGASVTFSDANSNGEIEAGESASITAANVNSGDTIRVNWVAQEGGTSSTIGTYEVP